MRAATIFTLILSLVSGAFAQSATLLVLNKIDNELAFVDPEAMTVIERVKVGVGPHEVCVTGDCKLAIVANYGTHNVVGQSLSIIDVATRKVLRVVDTLPLKRPHGLAEINGKIWFTSETSAAVGRYDPSTDKIDAIIGTGQGASHMVVANPKGVRLRRVSR